MPESYWNQVFGQVIPEAGFSYTDFKFDSTSGNNFNRFDGHVDLYSVGVNNIQLSKNILMGMYLYHSETDIDALLAVNPNPTSRQISNIKNDSLFMNFLGNIGQNFVLNVSGAYGHASNNGQVIRALGTANPTTGSLKNSSENWLLGGAVYYVSHWQHFQLFPSVQVLYTHNKTPAFAMTFSGMAPVTVPLLSTQAVYVSENLLVVYHNHPYISPFASVGLRQVPKYETSRPSFAGIAVNGALPQIIIDDSAVKLGGGMQYDHSKHLKLRLAYNYLRAGSVYTSHQGLVTLRYFTG